MSGPRGVARNRLWRDVTAEADIQRFYDEKVVTRLATSLHRNITDGALLPGSIHVGPPGWKSASSVRQDMPVAVGMIDEAVAPRQSAGR